jgi:hypothetical protein
MSIVCIPAGAAVLYDNGPLNGEIAGFAIGGGGGDYQVADSFVLTTTSVIDSISFGAWVAPDETISTLSWGITTVPDSFSGFIRHGVATVANGQPQTNSLGWSVSEDSFSLGSIHLPAGVYYLVLQNAVANYQGAPTADAVYWDENNGLSAAWSNIIGSLANYSQAHTSGSESFTIYGATSSETPEPASWALMLVGFGGLGMALRGAGRPRRA